MSRVWKIFGLAVMFCAVGAFIQAASAQDFSEYHQAPAKMIPGVRYTTGSVTSSGWEKSLTDGDPNLKHWNWASITSYKQSCYNKVPAGAFLKKNNSDETRPAGIYIKPIHVSADTYAQKREQPGVIVVGDTRSQSNVAGRVNLPRRQAQSQPIARSYNTNYGLSGRLRPAAQSESLASRQVTGRLLNTQ